MNTPVQSLELTVLLFSIVLRAMVLSAAVTGSVVFPVMAFNLKRSKNPDLLACWPYELDQRVFHFLGMATAVIVGLAMTIYPSISNAELIGLNKPDVWITAIFVGCAVWTLANARKMTDEWLAYLVEIQTKVWEFEHPEAKKQHVGQESQEADSPSGSNLTPTPTTLADFKVGLDGQA